MAKRRDSHLRDMDDGELEHGWAGAVEIDTERPGTGLGPDSGARKWVLLGVGTSCLLTAAFVLIATRDVAPAHAAEIEMPPEPSSEVVPAPTELEPAVAGAAVEPTSGGPARSSDATLAAGSSAAVQAKPSTPPLAVNKPPPVPAPKPKPAATPKPPPAATPKPPPAATPKPPQAPPVEPAERPKLPDDSTPPPDPSAELPDVEGWDDADDQAAQQDVEPS